CVAAVQALEWVRWNRLLCSEQDPQSTRLHDAALTTAPEPYVLIIWPSTAYNVVVLCRPAAAPGWGARLHGCTYVRMPPSPRRRRRLDIDRVAAHAVARPGASPTKARIISARAAPPSRSSCR